MKIAIMSDSHDHLEHFDKAIGMIRALGIRTILHCGDLSAPILLKKFAELEFELHMVSGNTNDEYTFMKICCANKHLNHHGIYADLELGGKKIAMVHYPELAEGLASTGKYNIIFYGHDHTSAVKKIGKTILANPGEILGFRNRPSIAVYDTETNEVEIKEVE
ncbi:YfcE family phosphodiesterase [Candidatus Woesearchaeota archaeon]|nr:YfcE family phosphodiesterase [Candidatus Woesearchaeota archaeon]